MAYTRAQLLAAIREDYPQLAKVKDDDLFRAFAEDNPDIAQPVIAAEKESKRLAERTPGEVASDQAAAVLRGIGKGITGLPQGIASGLSALYELGTQPSSIGDPQSQSREMLRSMVQPITTIYQGLKGEIGPDDPAWQQAAEGAGALLSGSEVGNVVGGVVSAAPKVAKTVAGKLTTAEAMDEAAAANVARALSPADLESKATLQRIAPKLSQRGLKGLTQSGIDESVTAGLKNATDHLNKVEARLMDEVRPEYQINTEPILKELDSSVVKLRGDNNSLARINSDAIKAVKEVRNSIGRLPKYASFEQVLKLRRGLDKFIDDAGGFKNASSTADKLRLQAYRGGADLLRRSLNDIDPALKVANQEYSLYRHASDVVERRQLGDVGKKTSGLPGSSAVLDDILATWAGSAIGGPGGAVMLEGLNLARQLPGVARVKATAQQNIANMIRQPKPSRLMIGPGDPQLGPVPDESSVTVESGQYGRPVGLLREVPTVIEATPITRIGPTGPYQQRAPVAGELGTGQRMIAETSEVQTPPPPPESMLDYLRRTTTPQSRRMRQVTSQGRFTGQQAPMTLQEYMDTVGGRSVFESERYKELGKAKDVAGQQLHIYQDSLGNIFRSTKPLDKKFTRR